MSVMTAPVRFVGVDAAGEQIKARRLALGMTVKGLAEHAKVDRGRLAALEGGDPTVRETTIGAVNAALSRLEHEFGMDAPSVRPIGDPGDDLVEFVVEGNFGVRAVVKGPVRDMAALQAAVSELVKDMQSGNDPQNP